MSGRKIISKHITGRVAPNQILIQEIPNTDIESIEEEPKTSEAAGNPKGRGGEEAPDPTRAANRTKARVSAAHSKRRW